MAWHWVSTRESVARDEISVLAIVETVVVVGVSIWVAVEFQTFWHIAVGGIIAPLLLMRSDESCVDACAIAKKMAYSEFYRLLEDAVDRRGVVGFLCNAMGGSVLLPMLGVVARLVAWGRFLVCHPIRSVSAVPNNWFLVNACVDSLRLPEFIPPPRKMSLLDPRVRAFHISPVLIVYGFWRAVFSDVKNKLHLIPTFVLVMSATPFLLSSWLYRWSLKSTAIIWFPLLWAMRSAKGVGGLFKSYLRGYVGDPITVIVLTVSALAILAFAVKVVLWSEWAGFVGWWDTTPLRRFFALYVTPMEIQWWQVATVVNSGLAILMYIIAWSWMVRIVEEDLQAGGWRRRAFQTGLVIRRFLSCYTILSTLYITFRAASDWNLPPLGTKPFPWM